MKKFLLSFVLSAIALIAVNSNAATSLTNFGALTLSWTILQQNEPVTNTSIKVSADGKKATNTVYDYKATTSSASFGNVNLLNLISNTFTNTIKKGDQLATDGEYIYVVDSTGSNVVLTNLSSVLTVTYSDSVNSGAATITTNKAETNTTYITNVTYTITTNTNVINTNYYVIIEVTNVVSMVSNTGVAYQTNIDTTTTTTYYYSTTNVLYTTITNYTTNFNNEVNTVITQTNIYAFTNVDTVITAAGTNSTTNFTYYTNYTSSSMVVPITNYVVYTTNITTNTTVSTPSGTASYTITSYFTLSYDDPATTNQFSYHGLAATAIDVNLAKDTATENFSVKSGVGSGKIDGKITLISGTITGSAKGKSSPPPE